MIDIGQKIPLLRTPAFTQGALTLFDFSQYNGHWLTLCGVSAFGPPEATLLDRYKDDFGRCGAILLTLCPNAPTFHAPWIPQTPTLRIPVLADPLSRLHRLLNLSRESPQGRCCSVLIDPTGIVRTRLTHQLDEAGMNGLKEALIANQQLSFPLPEGSALSSEKGVLTPCIL